MYRLREMDIDDKVCEQVSMTMLNGVYPLNHLSPSVSSTAEKAQQHPNTLTSCHLKLKNELIGAHVYLIYPPTKACQSTLLIPQIDS